MMAQQLPILNHAVPVLRLYERRRDEFEELGWELGDVYLELGGGSADGSGLHARFADFFNGQTRRLLAPEDQPKLRYWAGVPERGAVLRDRALARATGAPGDAGDGGAKHDHFVESASRPPGSLDPRTRALIVAHNQIDVELQAHLAEIAVEPTGRQAAPATRRTSRRSGAICVLGAPRSGTSLTARALNILGVDLGPEADLMPPAADNNRSGFWEHKGIADLNEEIFAALSESPPPYLQGWRWPPELGPGWEDDPRLEPHRNAAAAILRASFGRRRGPWGWKDPRTSLTLAFWQGLVNEMRYVVCVRHPLDVAASLEARDGMPVEESLRLWTRYMAAAVEGTEGRPRTFVAYESYFPDWRTQSGRLADFLGLAQAGDDQLAAIGAHIDASLRHHRSGGGELPAECATLYDELTRLAQG